MEKRVLIIFFFVCLVLPFVKADIISVNAGGSNTFAIDFGKYIEEFFPGVFEVTVAAVCGNSIVETGETCDDGNVVSGDGCSSSCIIEVTGVVTTDGGGGGGGGISQPAKLELSELKVVPESFNLPAIVGVTGFGKIYLSNTGGTDLNIEIELVNLDNIIEFEKTNLILKKDEENVLEFTILPQEKPGIYAGKIIFTTEDKKLEVLFILNVRSEMSLFDISIELSDENELIKMGQKLVGNIILIQAGFQEKVDVLVSYVIKDFEGNTYIKTSETIMVFKQKSYEYEFSTQDLPPGDYLIGTEVIYSGGVSTASHQFKVLDSKIKMSYFAIVLELIIGFVIIIALIVLIKRYKSKFPYLRK